jgi:hypothetical protein
VAQPSGEWRSVVTLAEAAIGPLPPAVAASWRDELEAVERLVAEVACPVPAGRGTLPDGALALVCLAAARLGTVWSATVLVEAAAAVELADRAVRHHARVTDRVAGVAAPNIEAVLDGDRSITRAAAMVAAIGPSAYRALVRGYGCVQLAALTLPTSTDGQPQAPRSGLRADANGLVHAAVSLGLIVVGQEPDAPSGPRPAADRLGLLVGWASGRAVTPVDDGSLAVIGRASAS